MFVFSVGNSRVWLYGVVCWQEVNNISRHIYSDQQTAAEFHHIKFTFSFQEGRGLNEIGE